MLFIQDLVRTRKAFSIRGGHAGLVTLAVLTSCSAPASHDGAAASPAKAAAASAVPDVTAQSHLRLMSQRQYYNTLVDIFGAEIVPALSFAPFQRTDGLLATGAAYDGVSGSQVEQFQRTASLIAKAIVSTDNRDFLLPCKPANEKAADAACTTKYISYIGPLLFRRPLAQSELTEFVGQAGDAANRLQNYYRGLSIALEGMLINPSVLYVKEETEADPINQGRQRLNAYSLASRLSLFLWNQAPDEKLLKAAANGDLSNPKARAKVVDMMLASPKLEEGMRAFFDDMLGFDDFATLAKDSKVYPAFTGQVAEEAREQTLRTIVDELLAKNGDYRDLFTTRHTFIAPSLAALYHEPAMRTWTGYTAPADEPRAGLLTQISFLALHSHPGRSSPTRRGKALRELLMCQKVPDPPANVDFSAVENPDPTLKTARDRLEAHRKNPVCAGCHKITDPIGLALENFDGSGQYRDDEHGAVIDASGSIDGKEFKDAVGLGQALHDSPTVTSCLVKRVFGYAIGGKLRLKDQPLVDHFNAAFAAGSYRLPNLLRTIALSPTFTEVDTSEDAPAPVKTAQAETATSGNQ